MSSGSQQVSLQRTTLLSLPAVAMRPDGEVSTDWIGARSSCHAICGRSTSTLADDMAGAADEKSRRGEMPTGAFDIVTTHG